MKWLNPSQVNLNLNLNKLFNRANYCFKTCICFPKHLFWDILWTLPSTYILWAEIKLSPMLLFKISSMILLIWYTLKYLFIMCKGLLFFLHWLHSSMIFNFTFQDLKCGQALTLNTNDIWVHLTKCKKASQGALH